MKTPAISRMPGGDTQERSVFSPNQAAANYDSTARDFAFQAMNRELDCPGIQIQQSVFSSLHPQKRLLRIENSALQQNQRLRRRSKTGARLLPLVCFAAAPGELFPACPRSQTRHRHFRSPETAISKDLSQFSSRFPNPSVRMY